jgi:hypothetical protein
MKQQHRGKRSRQGADKASAVQQQKTGNSAFTHSLDPDSKRDISRKEDLERFYAKPGKAEWGC